MKKQPKIKPAKAVNKQGKSKEFVKRQWSKGQSGNPAGRKPLEKSIPDGLRQLGGWECPAELCATMKAAFPQAVKMGDKFDLFTAMLLRAYSLAVQGDAAARQFIAERTEGKVPQGIVGGEDNGPVQVSVNFTQA